MPTNCSAAPLHRTPKYPLFTWLLFSVGISIAFLSALLPLPGLAAEMPPTGNTDYVIETMGPNFPRNAAGYYSNPLAGNAGGQHYVEIDIPCNWPTAKPIYIDLYSPSMDSAYTFDVDRTNNGLGDTHFELFAPGTAYPSGGAPAPGASGSLQLTPYTPGVSAAWVRFYTIPAPATCGRYYLRSDATDEDANAWRLRVGWDNDANPNNPSPSDADNPDGLPGTGDEIAIGIIQQSIQHPKSPLMCLSLFEYVLPGQAQIAFHNFDMEGVGSVAYTSPSGLVITGTVSASDRWNGGTALNRGLGDIVNNPEAGWWQITTCAGSDVHFIQEGLAGVPAYYIQPPTPALVVAKDDGKTTVGAGELLNYTIAFTNTSNTFVPPLYPGAATRVQIVDTLPSATTYVSCGFNAPLTGACVQVGNTITFTLDQLGTPARPGGMVLPGEQGSVRVTAQVNADALGAITNTVQVKYQDTFSHAFSAMAHDTDSLAAGPDLVLTKDDGGVTTTPGATVIYQLAYHNVGGQAATGVLLTEQVPANTTFEPSRSTPGWVCTPDNAAGSTCTLAIGSLGAGAGNTANFAVTVVNPFPAGVSQIDNTAQIRDDGANGADPTPQNNQASDSTPVIASPHLVAQKLANWNDANHDGGIDPGEVITYTIVIRNTGNQTILNVPVVDTPDGNTTLVAGTVGISGGTGVVNVGNQAGDKTVTAIITSLNGGGAEVRITYRVTINAALPAGVNTVVNHALVANTLPLSSTVPLVAVPDLVITKDDGAVSAIPGNRVAYTLTYSNVGQRAATGVVIKEQVPPNTTFEPSRSTPNWACTPNNSAGSTCTLSIGNLPAAGQGHATFVVLVDNPVHAGVEQVTNTASINDDGHNGQDPTPANNSASVSTPVIATPNLLIRKSAELTHTLPGTPILYTLVYTNAGNQDATGVVITEILPEWTTFNRSASTPGWACSVDAATGRTLCKFNVGPVPAGAIGQLKLTFVVAVDTLLPQNVNQIVNQVSIADDGHNGVMPGGQKTDTLTIPITKPTGLTGGDEPEAPALANHLYLPLVIRR